MPLFYIKSGQNIEIAPRPLEVGCQGIRRDGSAWLLQGITSRTSVKWKSFDPPREHHFCSAAKAYLLEVSVE